MSGERDFGAFIGQAEDCVRDLLAALDGLGAEPGRADLVERAVQGAHHCTTAADLGFTRLSGLARRMEEALATSRTLAAGLTPPMLDALTAGADLLAEMVAAVGRGEGDGTVQAGGVIEELGRWAPQPADAVAPLGPRPAAAADATGTAEGAEASRDPRLLAAFLEDAEDRSQRLASLLAALEPRAARGESIHETFRAAHDLKSASATAGFHLMSRLAHRMEDVLQRVRDGSLEISEPVRDALLEGSDRIAEMIAAVRRGDAEATVDTASAIADLSAFAPQAPQEAARPAAAEEAPDQQAATEQLFGAFERARVREAADRGEALYRLVCEMDPEEPMRFARAYLLYTSLEDMVNVVAVDPPMDPSAVEPDARGNPPDDRPYARVTVWFTTTRDGSEAATAAAGAGTVKVERLEIADLLGDLQASQPAPGAGAGRPPAIERATIRVDTRKLDALWGLVAELVQAKARLGTIADRLGRLDDVESARADLVEALDGLEKISGGMQQAMVETRMIPIRVIFEKFPRLVRDLSRKLHKTIDLELAGADTAIDRSIVEALSDPLMHLLRNAVDHGIEFPEDRVRHGKSERGRIRVAASQQGGRIVIEVADDGRGIDVEAVRRTALAEGIAGVAAMDERELCELVFRPGFSTREVVSELSGRGVGMDVVATRVRTDLKGEVLLRSRPGSGTQVTLVLPLTLTIMRALLVRGESHLFAVPLSGVETTTRVLNTEIRGPGERPLVVWQDAEIPLFTLGGLLGRPARRAEELAAVVLRRGAARACLVVDELLEERELVIRPLDEIANHHRLFSGVSIREDGRLVFVLDTSFVPEEGT